LLECLALLFEVNYLKTDIKKMMERLQEFMANEDMPLNLISPLDHAYIQNEPLGVVLIIGTWNYPFMLLLQPLVGYNFCRKRLEALHT